VATIAEQFSVPSVVREIVTLTDFKQCLLIPKNVRVFLVEAILWISNLKALFTYKINKKAVSHFFPRPMLLCMTSHDFISLYHYLLSLYPLSHYIIFWAGWHVVQPCV